MVDILPIRAISGIAVHFLLKRDEGAVAPSSHTHASSDTRKDSQEGLTRLISDWPGFGVGGLSAVNTIKSPPSLTRNNGIARSP